MRALLPVALLLAMPAEAQRASGPHDGIYEGVRATECRAGGRVRQDRIAAELRGRELVLPGLPGDPSLLAQVGPDGQVRLPPFGLFREGQGQVLQGQGNARRFVGSHPGRGDCQVTYDLLRTRPLPRGR